MVNSINLLIDFFFKIFFLIKLKTIEFVFSTDFFNIIYLFEKFDCINNFYFIFFFLGYIIFLLNICLLFYLFVIQRILVFSIKVFIWFVRLSYAIAWFIFYEIVFLLEGDFPFLNKFYPKRFRSKYRRTESYIRENLRFMFLLFYFSSHFAFMLSVRFLIRVGGINMTMTFFAYIYTFMYVLSFFFKEVFSSLFWVRTFFSVLHGETDSTWVATPFDTLRVPFWKALNFLNTSLLYFAQSFFNVKPLIKCISYILSFFMFLLVVIFAEIYLLLKKYNIFDFLTIHNFVFSKNKFCYFLALCSPITDYFKILLSYLFSYSVYVFGYLILSFLEIIYILLFLFKFLIKLIFRILIYIICLWMFVYFMKLHYLFSTDWYLSYSNVFEIGIFKSFYNYIIYYLNFENMRPRDIDYKGYWFFLKDYKRVVVYEARYAKFSHFDLSWAREVNWVVVIKFHWLKSKYMGYYAALVGQHFGECARLRGICPTNIHIYFYYHYRWIYFFYRIIFIAEFILIDFPLTWFFFINDTILISFIDLSYILKFYVYFLLQFCYLIIECMIMLSNIFLFFYLNLKTIFFSIILPIDYWVLCFTLDVTWIEFIIFIDILFKLFYYYVYFFFFDYFFLFFKFFFNVDYSLYHFIFTGGLYNKIWLWFFLEYLTGVFDYVYFCIDFLCNHFGVPLNKYHRFNYFENTSGDFVIYTYVIETNQTYQYFNYSNFKFLNYYCQAYNTDQYFFKQGFKGSVILSICFEFLVIICFGIFFFPKSFRAFTKEYKNFAYGPEYLWKFFLNNTLLERNDWIKHHPMEENLAMYMNSMSSQINQPVYEKMGGYVNYLRILTNRLNFSTYLPIAERTNYLKENVFPYVYDSLKNGFLRDGLSKLFESDYHDFYFNAKNHRDIIKLYSEQTDKLQAFFEYTKNPLGRVFASRDFALIEMYEMAHFNVEYLSKKGEAFINFFETINKVIFNDYSPRWLFGVTNEMANVSLVKRDNRKDFWCASQGNVFGFEFLYMMVVTVVMLIRDFYFNLGYSVYFFNTAYPFETLFFDIVLSEFDLFYDLQIYFYHHDYTMYGPLQESLNRRRTLVHRLSYGQSSDIFLFTNEMSLSCNRGVYLYNPFCFILYYFIDLVGHNIISIYCLFFCFIYYFLLVKFNFKFFLPKKRTTNVDDAIVMWGFVRFYKNMKNKIFGNNVKTKM